MGRCVPARRNREVCIDREALFAAFGEGRILPFDQELWDTLGSEFFNGRSNMVQMSDSAICYTRVPYNIGIEDGHSVNHSRKPTSELSRSVEALAGVVTRETHLAICSTNVLDPTWGE